MKFLSMEIKYAHLHTHKRMFLRWTLKICSLSSKLDSHYRDFYTV